MCVKLMQGRVHARRGRWLGLTKEQIDEKYPGDMDNFDKDPTVNIPIMRMRMRVRMHSGDVILALTKCWDTHLGCDIHT